MNWPAHLAPQAAASPLPRFDLELSLPTNHEWHGWGRAAEKSGKRKAGRRKRSKPQRHGGTEAGRKVDGGNEKGRLWALGGGLGE